MAEPRDTIARDALEAAQWNADVGVEHIADVYAQALLDAAQSAGQIDAVLDEFDALVSELLDRYPRWEEILGSALVSVEEKDGLLNRVLAGRVSPLLMNFLKVVSRHGRLDCLRAVHRRLRVLDDQRRGRIPVVLTTPVPVDAAAARQIAENLRGMLGGEPIIQWVTDPDLIGGAVLRVGDTVYDGSVAGQLEQLRQQILERSVHEIQSRRDRFSNSTRD